MAHALISIRFSTARPRSGPGARRSPGPVSFLLAGANSAVRAGRHRVKIRSAASGAFLGFVGWWRSVDRPESRSRASSITAETRSPITARSSTFASIENCRRHCFLVSASAAEVGVDQGGGGGRPIGDRVLSPRGDGGEEPGHQSGVFGPPSRYHRSPRMNHSSVDAVIGHQQDVDVVPLGNANWLTEVQVGAEEKPRDRPPLPSAAAVRGSERPPVRAVMRPWRGRFSAAKDRVTGPRRRGGGGAPKHLAFAGRLGSDTPASRGSDHREGRACHENHITPVTVRRGSGRGT